MQTEQARKIAVMAGTAIGSLLFLNECRFSVEPGHSAIKFSRFTGLGNYQYREGWHLRLPYFERPIDFIIQTRPKQIKAATANRDMQNVILTLRVLYRPLASKLVDIYRNLGVDYDEKVLPSIVNETLRSVVAQYSASQLLSQRDQVSSKIRRALEERGANFDIIIDDVSITELTFGKEYSLNQLIFILIDIQKQLKLNKQRNKKQNELDLWQNKLEKQRKVLQQRHWERQDQQNQLDRKHYRIQVWDIKMINVVYSLFGCEKN